MHGSGSSLQDTAAVRIYLDESGGEDPGTPHAVVGGMIINRSRYLEFEDAWDAMLDRYCLTPPLHMKEFGRPHGRFAKVSNACRFELFSEISELVNTNKIYSLSASLTNAEYQDEVNKTIRDKSSVYAMCFLLALMMTHKIAEAHSYHDRIPFIVDVGNPYAEHVRASHAQAIRMQNEGTFLNVGGLHFEDDRDFGILQAADVIAWGARREATNISFGIPFSPVTRILERERGHARVSWKTQWMDKLSENVMLRYAEAQRDEAK